MSKEKGADAAWKRAVVGKVYEKGPKPYALTYLQGQSELGRRDVTFSLSDWQGMGPPQNGQVVELSNVRLFAHGWRAEVARPVMLDDQNSQA